MALRRDVRAQGQKSPVLQIPGTRVAAAGRAGVGTVGILCRRVGSAGTVSQR